MIGFNNIGYDYPMIDHLFRNPHLSAQQLRMKNDEIFNSNDRYGNIIWANNRFAPQIDLFKIHHFDNKAKSQSLKGLEVNMRSPNVVENKLGFERPLTQQEINEIAIPYNFSDVSETKKFAHHSMQAIDFRLSLLKEHGLEVMNWNDTKIGEEGIIKKIGEEICFDKSSGRKQKRQTHRDRIDFKDVIFDYIHFNNPEFNKVLEEFKSRSVTAEQVGSSHDDGTPTLKTKGVFKNLKATVGGVDFKFGVGGIHGSVERKKIQSTQAFVIRDIDVASLYPNIAIKNNLSPAHLGSAFTQVYSQIPAERKQWQKTKGKKCVEANALKLAANGAYGKSNSKFSALYDPLMTMTITINGQLMLAMLIEWLSEIPTLQLIQGNTDGVTYYIDRNYEYLAEQACRKWEDLTKLELEDVDYNRMFIRDVNSYIAEDVDGGLKLKGAYWTPDPLNYAESISTQQPPAWHKNLSNAVSTRAAVAYMMQGVDPETYIKMCKDPYDFLINVKIKKNDTLMWGDQEMQKNTRYFVSNTGADLIKYAKPKGVLGAYKKANGITDQLYKQVMTETGGQWDERVCTKNQSKYEISKTNLQAGQKVVVANDIADFDFNNVNYAWHLEEARKLIL